MKKKTKIMGIIFLACVIAGAIIGGCRWFDMVGYGTGWSASSSIPSVTVPKSEEEKRILSVLDDMLQSQRRGMANVPVEDGRLLRVLAETMGARHIVEIGTSNGFSALWLCLALQATGGKLLTHEINPSVAALASENFKKAGVSHMVTIVLGDAHEQVRKLKGPIDLLFLDADKAGYVDYLNKLLPLVRPGGLVVAHNMNFPSPDPDYIEAVTTNPDLDTIFLNMDGPGVGVTLKKQ